MTRRLDIDAALGVSMGGRWLPSGFDIAGSAKPAWLSVAGIAVALALAASFYGVVDGAVRRADRVRGDAGATAVNVSRGSVVHASF